MAYGISPLTPAYYHSYFFRVFLIEGIQGFIMERLALLSICLSCLLPCKNQRGLSNHHKAAGGRCSSERYSWTVPQLRGALNLLKEEHVCRTLDEYRSLQNQCNRLLSVRAVRVVKGGQIKAYRHLRMGDDS